MSSSFLFNQSPDWAKIIGDSYASVNASEEANEQLEKQNDQTRIEEAGVPMQMLKSIAEFSGTAKKLANAVEEKKGETAERQASRGFSLKDIKNEYEPVETLVKTEEKAANGEIKKKIEDGDVTAAAEIKAASIGKNYREQTDYAKNQVVGNIDTLFMENIGKYKTKDGFKWDDAGISAAGRSEIYTKFLENHIYGPAIQKGLKHKFIRKYVDKAVFKHKDKQAQLHQTKKEKQFNADQERDKTLGVLAVHNTEGINNAALEWVDVNAPSFGEGNTGKRLALEDFYRRSLALAASGHPNVSTAKLRANWESLEIDHAGSGKVLAKDQFPLLNIEIQNGLIEAETKLADREVEEQKAYAASREEMITNFEEENGRLMTNKELAVFLKENWDPMKGGEIPESLKGRLTKEDHDDDIQLEYIEHLYDLNILDKAEVYKLNDGKLREEWLKKAAEGNPSAANKTQISQAKKKAEGFANKRAKQFGVRPGKENDQWNNIVINAENQFPALYKEAMKTANSEADAFKTATDKMEQLIKDGDYDELLTTESDPLKRARNLFRAEKHIEINPDVVNTGIIYGTEDIVEAAKDLPLGEVHLAYKQLGNKLGILPAKLQHQQLSIAAKLKGENEPVKSEILLAWEKLPETTQELLCHHVDPARVIRAKIEAFKDDAQIDYNEVGFLIDDIINDPATYPEFATTETVFEPPKVRKLTKQQEMRRKLGSRNRDNQQAEQLKEFIRGFGNFLMEYPSDVFATEIEAFKQFGEAIEERKEEVKKRPKTRKR